jgi:hypothetical protein
MTIFALSSLLITLVLLTLGLLGVKGVGGLVAVAFFLFLMFSATALVTSDGRLHFRRRLPGENSAAAARGEAR